MNQTNEHSEQVARSVSELVQHYFSTPIQNQLKTSVTASSLQPLKLDKTWTLHAKVQQETLVGRQGNNQFGTFRECEKAFNSDIEKIKSGSVAGFVEKLSRFVAEDPLKGLWQRTCPLDNYGSYFYVHHCSQCGGHGQQTCSSCSGRGKKLCYSCAGSCQMTCVGGCSGSGYIGHGDFRKVCGSCGGRGTATCTGCFGAGERRCDDCVGRGKHSCNPCNATGFFTEQYWLTVFGIGTIQMQHQAGLPDWQEDYLTKALEQQANCPPLSEACALDFSTLLRREQDYPIKFQIDGEVRFTEARLELHDTVSNGMFVGSHCQAYNLDQLGDAVFKPVINSLEVNQSATKLRKSLTLSASEQLLSNRNNAEANQSTALLATNIISSEAENAFLQRFKQLTDGLGRRRSALSTATWLRNSAIHAFVFLALAAIFSAASSKRVNWEQVGINAVVNDRNFFEEFFEFTIFHWFSGIPYTYGITAAGMLAIYLICKWLLSSKRKSTKLGFIAGIFLTNCLVFLGLVMLTPALAIAFETSFAIPSPSSFWASFVESLILLPEALLLGTLIAMLRLRRANDSRLLSFVKEIGSEPLLKDLGYK